MHRRTNTAPISPALDAGEVINDIKAAGGRHLENLDARVGGASVVAVMDADAADWRTATD